MTGPEEMDAHREHFDNLPEDPDDRDYDQDLPSDLVDMAEVRLTAFSEQN